MNHCKYFYPLDEERFNILNQFCLEEDFRVRAEALKIFIDNLLKMHHQTIQYHSKMNNSNNFFDNNQNNNQNNIINNLTNFQFNQITIQQQEKLFQISSQLMDDLFPLVRIRSLELLVIIWNINTYYVNNNSCNYIELFTDKIFCLICDKIRDTDIAVRTRATRLLGYFHNVSKELLFDTFDKMRLDTSKVIRFKKVKQPEHFAQASSISVNQEAEIDHKTTIDVLQTELDITAVKNDKNDAILSDTAVGAFVLALEDEHQSVRMAAIASISELSEQVDQFSKLAIDFVIEMFNDDIDAVRIFAIEAVSKIGAFIDFNEDQIHIALSLLDDGSFDIRQSVRDFLSKVTLASSTCLQAAFVASHTCLKKYPQDEMQTLYSLKELGRNHPHLTILIVEELLHLEKYILKPKMVIDDIYFISTLILLCNGSVPEKESDIVGIPTIFSLLPDFIYEHYKELRYKSKYMDLFPTFNVKSISSKPIFGEIKNSFGTLTYIIPEESYTLKGNDKQANTLAFKKFFNFQKNQDWLIKFNEAKNEKNFQDLSFSISNALKQFKNNIVETTSRTIKVQNLLLIQFTKCILNYIELVKCSKLKFASSHTSQRIHAQFCTKCCELNYQTYIIQNRFTNLPPSLILQLKILRLSSLVISIISGISLPQSSNNWRIKMKDLIYNRVIILNEEAKSLNGNGNIEILIQSLMNKLSNIYSINHNQSSEIVFQCISNTYFEIVKYLPQLEESMFNRNIEHLSFQITSPTSEMEKVYDYLCYIPMNIELKGVSSCSLEENFVNNRFRIIAELSNSTEQWFCMKIDHEASIIEKNSIQNSSKNIISNLAYDTNEMNESNLENKIKYRHLCAELNIELSNWISASTLRLRPALIYEPDIPDEYRIILGQTIDFIWTDLGNNQCCELSDISSYREHSITLCESSIQLLIHPHT